MKPALSPTVSRADTNRTIVRPAPVSLSSKHRATLRAVFSQPVPKTLEWRRIEALFVAIGCTVIEGDGSRVGFRYGARRADFHRPHPGKEAKPYYVRDPRAFLETIGVTPETL